MAALVTGCARTGDDKGKVEDRLRDGLSIAYGPVDSVNCKENDEAKVGNKTAYDCTVHFKSGAIRVFCAFLASEGLAAWNKGACRGSM